MKANKNRTKNIVVLSITLALIIVLQLFSALLQKLGMPMSLALGLIPVFVIAQTHGVKFGAISGLFFGLITLLFSVIYMGAMPMYRVTANPLVSVFPRIMAGTVCAVAYSGFAKLYTKRNAAPTRSKRRLTMLAISTFSTILGVITNTVLFLGMFFAFAHGRTFDNLVIDFRWILSSIVALNTVIELVVFAITVPSTVFAMTESKLATKIYGINKPMQSEDISEENTAEQSTVEDSAVNENTDEENAIEDTQNADNSDIKSADQTDGANDDDIA